jgi:nitrate/nitrite transporter NarK
MIQRNGKLVPGFALGDDVSPTPHHSVLARTAVAGAVGAAFGAGMSYADTKRVKGSAMAYGAAIGAIGALVAIKMP